MDRRTVVKAPNPPREHAPGPGDPAASTGRVRLRRAAPDVAGLSFVVVAAVAVLLPALLHGGSLGSFDLLSRYGVTKQSGVTVHNAQTTDLISQMIPWTSLAWTQVHAGHLPLWNPYNGLGMPLAFNWQSATFGLPTLLGYLAPLRFAFTVQVVVTLVLAGTGTYVLGRVLGLGITGCVMAGVVYELSGTFMGFLGWPIASVLAWTGWLFAAAILIVRGRHRIASVVFFAIAVAGSVYAGQPDALALLAPGLLVFIVVLLAMRARSGGLGGVTHPILDVAIATVVGGALAAPLILPGLPLTTGSVFYHAARTNGALPTKDVVNLIFQGYNALPVAQGHWFGVGTSAYVGVIALVLALVGAVVCRHRPEVLALVGVGIVMGAVVFIPQVASLLNQLPFRARWHLGLVVVSFVIAVLAGFGIDALIRSPRDWTIRVWSASGFAVSGLVIAALWVIGRGSLTPEATRLRSESFIWPTILTVVGLVVMAALSRGSRRTPPVRPENATGRSGVGRWVGYLFLLAETGFLVGVGAPLWSSSPNFLTSTPAETRLASAVGPSVVGFGVRSCELPPTLGILPETNAAFGVHELAAYDPITPRAYFRAFKVAPGILVSAFCPVVKTVAQARRYGVEFVLEPKGVSGPPGAVFDETIADEALYRIPGASAATVTPLPVGGRPPGADAQGTPVAVTYPGPGEWKVVTHGTAPQLLRLRLTDVPGWHATIDGHPLVLEPFSGIMLQARIPSGTHIVELHYWPSTFTLGIVLAGASTVGLVVASGVGWRRRRGIRATKNNLTVQRPEPVGAAGPSESGHEPDGGSV
jgi:hypothetical protein